MPGEIQVSHVSSGARRDPARWRPDTMTLPLVPTAVVGSHGKPGWWFAGVKAYERGAFGPADLEEMFDDAVHAAVRDMETAGIDVITDGEVRRLDGYVDSYYAIIKGIEPVTVRRKAGPWGYDQQTRYEAIGRIETAPGRSPSAHGSTRARCTRASWTSPSASPRSSIRSCALSWPRAPSSSRSTSPRVATSPARRWRACSTWPRTASA